MKKQNRSRSLPGVPHMKIVFAVFVVALFQCTKPTLATEVKCKAETQMVGTYSEAQGRMAGASETAPGEEVQLLGIGSKSPVLMAQNAKSVLLPIKTDDESGVYQFFEKAPLGTPIVWAYYSKDARGKKKLAKHQLVRLKSYREDLPVAIMTTFGCE